MLLVGWAIGGIVFGAVADRIGRTRTLLLTMMLYAFGTAACAAAPNMPVLVAVPPHRQPGHRRRMGGRRGDGGRGGAREAAGRGGRAALHVGAHGPVPGDVRQLPDRRRSASRTRPRRRGATSSCAACRRRRWRFVVRIFVSEPERWKQAAAGATPPRLRELFTPNIRARTLSGFSMALVALITWWSCNAFIPIVSTGLAQAGRRSAAWTGRPRWR